MSHINYSEDSTVKCPFGKDYNCTYHIQDREIRALLTPEEYNKMQMKSLRQSEATMSNTFHCKSPDCIGFCVYEDNLNFFDIIRENTPIFFWLKKTTNTKRKLFF